MERNVKLIAIIVAAVFLCGGFVVAVYKFRLSGGPGVGGIVTLEKDTVTVYFPSAGRLLSKTLEVQGGLSDRGRADLVFQELKRERTVAERVKLLELAFGQDGVLYLNVSGDLVEKRGDAVQDALLTYGLVNSFIKSFRDVQKVQILIEGKPVYTIGGLLYSMKPLDFNKQVLEE